MIYYKLTFCTYKDKSEEYGERTTVTYKADPKMFAYYRGDMDKEIKRMMFEKLADKLGLENMTNTLERDCVRD